MFQNVYVRTAFGSDEKGLSPTRVGKELRPGRPASFNEWPVLPDNKRFRIFPVFRQESQDAIRMQNADQPTEITPFRISNHSVAFVSWYSVHRRTGEASTNLFRSIVNCAGRERTIKAFDSMSGRKLTKLRKGH